MSTPSGYPGNSNDPYGTAGQQPGGYHPPSAPGGYQQPAPYPGPEQYGQYPAGNAAYPAPNPYGQPGMGMVTGARPGMVTAAAVLAFIWGGLGILFGLIGLAAGTFITSASNAICNDSSLTARDSATCNSVTSIGPFLIIITIGTIIVAGLMIWGGVVALNGKNGQILVIACGVYAALAIISLFASGFGFTSLLGFVIPVLIVVFMLNAASKAWFKTKGGKTF
jgi:hypothetical protein